MFLIVFLEIFYCSMFLERQKFLDSKLPRHLENGKEPRTSPLPSSVYTWIELTLSMPLDRSTILDNCLPDLDMLQHNPDSE